MSYYILMGWLSVTHDLLCLTSRFFGIERETGLERETIRNIHSRQGRHSPSVHVTEGSGKQCITGRREGEMEQKTK